MYFLKLTICGVSPLCVRVWYNNWTMSLFTWPVSADTWYHVLWTSWSDQYHLLCGQRSANVTIFCNQEYVHKIDWVYLTFDVCSLHLETDWSTDTWLFALFFWFLNSFVKYLRIPSELKDLIHWEQFVSWEPRWCNKQ